MKENELNLVEEIVLNFGNIIDPSNSFTGILYVRNMVEVNMYLDDTTTWMRLPYIELEFLDGAVINHLLNVSSNIVVSLQEGPLQNYENLDFSLVVSEKMNMVTIKWHNYTERRNP